MLQVHVRHFGWLSASDAIVVLHLKTPVNKHFVVTFIAKFMICVHFKNTWITNTYSSNCDHVFDREHTSFALLCVNGVTYLTRYLRDGPAKHPQFVQGPVFSYRSVREADSVPGEKSLRCMQLGTGPSCHSFQNVSGGVKPRPRLVRFYKMTATRKMNVLHFLDALCYCFRMQTLTSGIR